MSTVHCPTSYKVPYGRKNMFSSKVMPFFMYIDDFIESYKVNQPVNDFVLEPNYDKTMYLSLEEKN